MSVTESLSYFYESYSSIKEFLADPMDSLFPDYIMAFFGMDRGDIGQYWSLPELGRNIVSVCLFESDATVGEVTRFFTNSGYCIDEVLGLLTRLDLPETTRILSSFKVGKEAFLGQRFSYENENQLLELCGERYDFGAEIPIVMHEAEGLLTKLHAYCIDHLKELSEFESKRS